MGKFNLIKPDLRTGYLKNENRSKVTYLNIDPEWDKDTLEEDIKMGAAQFKSIIELTEKNPSRYVIVETDNEEQGLLAVSYLAGIHNSEEGVYSEEFECDTEDFMSDCFESDVEDFEYEITSEEYGYEGDEYETRWVEVPYRIPVINLEEIKIYLRENVFNPVAFNSFNMLASENRKNEFPYWFNCESEPVCILVNSIYSFSQEDVKLLKKFSNNRHVYIMIVNKNNEVYSEEDDDMEDEEDMLPFGFSGNPALCLKNRVNELLLEYTARMIKIGLEKDKQNKEKYYNNVFDSWLIEYGLTVKRGFRKKKLVSEILKMMREDKCTLIEKVILYAKRDVDESGCVSEKDFAILSQFGCADKKTQKQTALTMLDNNLVGMDNIKQQIKDIVKVMKFNKKRKMMGFNTEGFHNVHMMIGAPGTAKTTVAQLMGNIMIQEKLLEGNRFISINGAELKGMYVGHSAPKTKALFDNNDIIFIDEAYSAVSSGSDGMDSYSEEAIAQLIIEIEKHATDRLVIFAGYGGEHVSDKDNKMKAFLDANPGLKSRINSTIYFDSYTPNQMLGIVHKQAEIRDCTIDKSAEQLILDYFTNRVTSRDFGNGREARSFVEQCLLYTARRVMILPEKKITKKMLCRIQYEDVQNAIAKIEESNRMQIGRVKKCGFWG